MCVVRSVSASGALGASGAALASLQLCCAAWAACVAALRDERLDALLDDAGDGDKASYYFQQVNIK